MKNDWAIIPINRIISGKFADGSSMLKQFLIDYKNTFNVNTVNPNCSKCLHAYHLKFINTKIMKNTECDYALQKKYEGITLGFGKSTVITNTNITNEIAEKLIAKYSEIYEKKGKEFEAKEMFVKFPENWEDKQFNLEDIGLKPIKKAKEKAAKPKLKDLRKQYPNIKATSVDSFLEKVKALPAVNEEE